MRCKNCGAQNEDYLEYCEQCAAPLTPDDAAQSDDPGYKSYAASTGETPPAWGFVKAPQWPKPDFDANTVSEEDIPENYAKKFTPRPADEIRQEAPKAAPAAAYDSAYDEAYARPARAHGASAQSAPHHRAAPAQAAASGRAYEAYRGADAAAQIADEDEPVPAKPRRAQKKAEDEFSDFGGGYGRARAKSGSGRKRNVLFVAAAGVLVLLIAIFTVVLVSTKYAGNFGKFISCTFAGDPITRTPTVEATINEHGDPSYLIMVYTKNNYYVRFTAGDLVHEFPITKGSQGLVIPEKIWIPDEPLESATLSVTPDIVVISPKGVETKVEFETPLTINVPAITLTMTQPTVSDFTVDSTTVPIAGHVSDNTASIFVGENQVAVDEAGNFSTNYTLPGEGTYVLEVKAQKNGYMSAVQTYNVTYGTAGTPTTPEQGNVAFSVNDDVKRYGTGATMAVAGTMEPGAVISVSGVELEGAITQDSAAGTFSFTVKTAEVGVYEAAITATKGDAAKTSTLYLEHQPEKDAYMGSVYRIDYARIRDYPNHEQGYKIVGTITEVKQTAPFVIARIQTSEGDIMFCYFSGVSTIEVGDGKTYELYADPFGTDEQSGLPYMHAWFILKRSN